MKRLVTNLTASALLVGASTAQQHFTELVPIAAAPYGFGLAAVDLDGDGDTDLVTGPWDVDGRVQTLLNDGNGTLSELPGAGPVAGLFTNDLAAADVDGDGDVDVVVVNFQRPMQLYLNDGHGAFADHSAVGLGSLRGYQAASLADFDGDGDADLVIAGAPTEEPQLLINDGTGTFTRSSKLLPPTPDMVQRLRAADLDGDHDLDLVVATNGRDLLWINDGAGGMLDRSAWLPAGTRPTADAQIGDVDGDGDPDVVLGRGSSPALISVLLNEGNAHFAARRDVAAFPHPVSLLSVALGDADEDGDLDLAVGTWSDAPLELYLNDGTGRFKLDPSRTPSGDIDATRNTVFADMDGDGDLDLVLGNQFTGVTRNTSRVYTNLQRQALAAVPPRVGTPYAIDLFSQPGFGTAVAVAFPLVGSAGTPMPLGALGVLRLDPASALALPLVLIPAPAGRATLNIAIPNDPTLAGQELSSQALFAQSSGQAHFGNLVSGVIAR